MWSEPSFAQLRPLHLLRLSSHKSREALGKGVLAVLVVGVLLEGWLARRLQEGGLADVALDVLCLLVLQIRWSAIALSPQFESLCVVREELWFCGSGCP
jgi:hypothetical protein